MAVPFYKAIPGEFVLVGKEPDGDSVRFVADELDSPYKPMQLLKINGLLVWEQ
jgi:hypothetical protein